ncbi:hypothetical protein [Leclercia adecarboxylata]|uniref:hypothetical protein n=1 Tax=Leclercia adecarboxylata TaxID=83655 RepID=UPI002B2DEE82|nr:hypothetical protein NRF19_23470 [Leclercia adecarboxylata]
MIKKYIVLGSCRVVNIIATEIGDNVIVLNKNDLWFTHYPDEHIQKIKHLFGVGLIPNEHKDIFVRFEQQNQYGNYPQLRVGDSIDSGMAEFHNNVNSEVLNVAVELPTTRYIKVPINNEILWGHIMNLDRIRSSPFNQTGGNYTDEEFLRVLNDFEQVVINSVLSSEVAKAVNFIYVPHIPFIELKEGGWGMSNERVHIFDLIRQHCFNNADESSFPVTRCSLDIKVMIEENGGVDGMLTDQNHYTKQGQKVVFNYLNKLAL